jgi:tRNA(fMet)-specific endonuclease VapC
MLDTNICIYLINNKLPELAKRITEIPNEQICVSSITQAELEYGVAKSQNRLKNAQALAKFLSVMNVLSFDSNASVEYGEIRADLERRGMSIGPLDMLIAGHAKSLGYIVVTNNTREFARVDGLSVEDWTIH